MRLLRASNMRKLHAEKQVRRTPLHYVLERERDSTMSIISSEAEHVYKGNEPMQETYISGALRQPTEAEIEAAIGEVQKFIVLPGGYLENIIRIAFNAARRKATEE